MAFDAFMLRAVLHEYESEFTDAKIEKVLQPRNDEIDLLIRSAKITRRLVFNVGPNAPRLQLSDAAKENPLKAPMFCMLLRKHITGGRITKVSQLNFDRIAEFTISCYDEMGFATSKKLICEIMGKYANLILLDAQDKVITAIKIVDFSASTVRQVLPGLKYQIPDKITKKNPTEESKEGFFSAFKGFPSDKFAEKFITQTYSGIATQIARELVFRASEKIDTPIALINLERFYSVFSEWQKLLISHDYTPTVVYDCDDKPIDYSYMDITHYGNKYRKRNFESLRELFDEYFLEKDRIERIHQRAHDLITLISNSKSRTERKLAAQRAALLESEKMNDYKKQGDLITANLYRLKKGMESFVAKDFYDPEYKEVEILLDCRLDPSANAQKMYKLYNKCKTAKKVLSEQISLWERELLYLESVSAFLERAESEQDLVDIRDELYRSGYSSKMKNYKPGKQEKLRPIEAVTDGGYKLFCGRNNIQNDNLTFKVADKNDLWFHVKDLPGSHVILITDGKEPGERDYTQAAALAARYSKATADTVAVDYTRVKYIKKPQGSKPGFVTYKTNYTAYVKPTDAPEVK